MFAVNVTDLVVKLKKIIAMAKSGQLHKTPNILLEWMYRTSITIINWHKDDDNGTH